VADGIHEWGDGLMGFAADVRRGRPPAAPDDAAVAAAERAIIAASLVPRLAGLASVCEAWRGLTGSHASPVVVVTTSAAGLVAVEGLVTTGPEIAAVAGAGLVAVTELEYRLWGIRHPDVGHRLHVNLWSWVKTRVPLQRWPEFAAHPLGPGESYWLHREGLAGAGALDRRASHLWKWNGRQPALLKAFVAERGVETLAAARSPGEDEAARDP